MSNNNTINNTAIIDEDRGYRQFASEELYNKETGTGYIPNPGDTIRFKDPDPREVRIVETVDYTNLTWTTGPYPSSTSTETVTIVGGHYPLKSDAFRIFVDTSKHPATMALSDEITFKGQNVHAVRIFRGEDITSKGEVLSGFMVDGRLEYNYLPVSSVTVNGEETIVKNAVVGVCTASVKLGELVTGVVYSDDNVVIYKFQAYIITTNLIMPLETPATRVLDIKLESTCIRDESSDILYLPLNYPIDDIPMRARITYENGPKFLPVDGTRVKLNGLRNSGSHSTFYISSNAGHTLPLVLSYQLGSNESYVGDLDINDNVIMRDYRAITEVVDEAYSFKLYIAPYWISVAKGYRLKYFLYSLTRGTIYDVTNYVTYTTGTSFEPMAYGIKQTINVQVDTDKVSPIFNKGFIHNQSYDITLVNQGTVAATHAIIQFTPEGEKTGTNCFAKFEYSNVNYSEIDISCGFVNLSEWLQELYYNAYPLYDYRTELDGPLTPTHFELVVNDKKYFYPIGSWNEALVVDTIVTPNDTCLIKFITRNAADDLNVGLASLVMNQSN